MSVSVGIVDDDPLAMQALEWLLQRRHAPVTIIWTLRSGEDAIEHCAESRNRPEIVLSDIRLSDMSGMELTKRLKANYPPVQVIGITAFTLTDILEEAKSSGMFAVFHKDADLLDIVHAIGRASCSQEALFWTGDAEARTLLSQAELHVIREYAKGRTTASIAKGMTVSETTIKTYSRRAFQKLGVHSRSEAVVECAKIGVL